MHCCNSCGLVHEFKPLKATGLFCLLGIGIGLGSLFVYKLYTRFFPKALLPPSASAKLKRPNSGCEHLVQSSGIATDKTLAETPDSGISPDTVAVDNNDASHFACGPAPNPETYSVRQGSIRRRNTVAEWLAHTEELATSTDLALGTDFSDDNYGNQRDLMKSMRSWRSSGYLSTDHAHCEGVGVGEALARQKCLNEQGPACFTLDEDFAYDEVLSITDHILVPSILSESPEDELSDPGADELGFTENGQEGKIVGKPSTSLFRHRKLSAGSFLSGDIPRLWLRRNHHSFSSDLSAGSSGCTYRESLVSKGFSIDLGEDLNGMMTPPDGESGALDHWTMSSMDQLHKELKKIQGDIDYMNEKVEVLLSKEDGIKLAVALTSAEEDGRMVRRGSKSRHRSRSLSPTRSRSCSIDRDIAEDDLDSPDFIWDYHSDLALDKCDKPMFVVKRPHHVLNDNIQNQQLAGSPESEAIPDGAGNHRLLVSKRRNSSRLDPFSFGVLGESFDDGVILKNRNLKSSPPVYSSVHPKREESRDLFSSDTDQVSCSPQSLVCDHVASFAGICFSNTLCGHPGHSSFVSVSDACCTCEPVVLVHPHNPCPSCHGLRRGRAMSARTCRKSERPSSSSSHSVACHSVAGHGCSCCQSPPVVHRCVNMPIVRCQSNNGSVIQVERSSDSLSRNLTGSRALKLQLPLAKSHFSGTVNGAKVKVIGNKINLKDYLEQEFAYFDRHHGTKKGYDLLHQLWGVTGIRKLYSDNYSNLRAVLYQVLLSNVTILNKSGSFQCSVQKLATAFDSGHSYLANWRFGNGSNFCREEVVMKMTEYLRALFEQVEAVSDMSSVLCREQYLLALLNHSPEMDLSLLEGLKILMTLKAIELFNDHAGQKNAPSFLLRLFANESSSSPESLFDNHINVIGSTASMKAVEMCLLGVTLGVRIEVMRPFCFNREDFVVHFPDEGADHFHKVHIIEEDVGNFCVPVMKYSA